MMLRESNEIGVGYLPMAKNFGPCQPGISNVVRPKNVLLQSRDFLKQ